MADDRHDKTGACLCGAVKYSLNGPLKQVVGCHCTMCRKQTGHFLAFTAVWKDHFTLTEERGLKWYQSSENSRRGFCGKCGSVLFFDTDGDEKLTIAPGSIDGATGLEVAAHIFVADKGDYYALDDGCPQYDQGGDTVAMPARS